MPGVMPGAAWVSNDRNAGGTYVNSYPWRICLHTIEGGLGTLSASLPASHPYCPHVWYDPSTRRLYQTVPLDRSAFALYQGNGPHTNKARALQVEIAGHAATAGEWPDEYLVNIARDVIVPFVEFVRSQGSDINLDHVTPIGAIGGSASEHAPQRMSNAEWTSFDGVCSHRHVPAGNDHWDTGTLNVDRVVQLTKELLGGYSSAGIIDPEEEEPDLMMKQYVDRKSGKVWGVWGPFKLHILSPDHFNLLVARGILSPDPIDLGNPWDLANLVEVRPGQFG